LNAASFACPYQRPRSPNSWGRLFEAVWLRPLPWPSPVAGQEFHTWLLAFVLHWMELASPTQPQDEPLGVGILWRLPLLSPRLSWLLFEQACESTLPCGQRPLSAAAVSPSCPLPLCRRPTQSLSAVLLSGSSPQDRPTAVKGLLIGSRLRQPS
jgi:hypothetical protein